MIAGRKDVFRRHEEFFDGRHHAPLEQDWFAREPHLFEEGEVLDVARADLDDIGVLLHQFHIGGIHDLGDDR